MRMIYSGSLATNDQTCRHQGVGPACDSKTKAIARYNGLSASQMLEHDINLRSRV